MPADIKPVLDSVVKVFDALNRMNRGEVFDTLEILKDSNLNVQQKIEKMEQKKLSFRTVLEDIKHDIEPDLMPLFEKSLQIQMAAIQYTAEDKKKAIDAWKKHLFSKKMTVYRLSESEFEKLNPASGKRDDDRFKGITATLTNLLKDLERIWLGMTSQHVCILVGGRKLYRLNSMFNLFEATFQPIETDLEVLNEKIPLSNTRSIVLKPKQIATCIQYEAFSKSLHSERFEWEFKRKENEVGNQLIFSFNQIMQNSIIRPLDMIGVISSDILSYFSDYKTDKNKLVNLATLIVTLALLALAVTATIGLFISNPVGWAAVGAFMTMSMIFTVSAIISRSVNLIGLYLTHAAADNPNKDAFLSAESRFRLTEEEEDVYREKGYSEQQINTVKEALVACAIDMKLFSEPASHRHQSFFIDKMQQNTVIRDLKTCHLEERAYIVKTESRWKHGGIDRDFVIGAPKNPNADLSNTHKDQGKRI